VQVVKGDVQLGGDVGDGEVGLEEEGEGAVDELAVGLVGLRGVRV
jgi:hypothetical protein